MKIAILGAGKVGTAIARVALEAGHEVRIAGSADPDQISLLVEVVAPGATPLRAEDAVDGADVVILSLASPKYATLDPGLLSGRVVVDAMNYWPDTDGHIPVLQGAGTSEVVAAHLPGARVVKTLNHIGYHDLESHRKPLESPERRALAVISDDPVAADLVAQFVDSIGYDPVPAGPLALGRRVQPGTVIFTSPLSRAELRAALVVNDPTLSAASTSSIPSERNPLHV